MRLLFSSLNCSLGNYFLFESSFSFIPFDFFFFLIYHSPNFNFSSINPNWLFLCFEQQIGKNILLTEFSHACSHKHSTVTTLTRMVYNCRMETKKKKFFFFLFVFFYSKFWHCYWKIGLWFLSINCIVVWDLSGTENRWYTSLSAMKILNRWSATGKLSGASPVFCFHTEFSQLLSFWCQRNIIPLVYRWFCNKFGRCNY